MWKNIPEYEGIYKINKYGIVINSKTNKIRKPQLLNGYLTIGLCKNDKKRHLKYINLLQWHF